MMKTSQDPKRAKEKAAKRNGNTSQTYDEKRMTIADVATAVFGRVPSNGAGQQSQPLTENSPGVKLRRAEELYKRATSR